MKTPNFSIALHLQEMTYSVLKDFSQKIHNGLATHSLDYPSPSPDLLTFQSHIDDMQAGIVRWGVKGNQGSDLDLSKLLDATGVLHNDLKSLANYAEMTQPNNVESWMAVGFVVKNQRHLIGILGAPQNLHQVINNRVMTGTTKLRWSKPLDAVRVQNIHYKIFRSVSPAAATFSLIDVSTKTSWTDTYEGIPTPANKYYYKVVPVHTAGDGVASDICSATPMF